MRCSSKQRRGRSSAQVGLFSSWDRVCERRARNERANGGARGIGAEHIVKLRVSRSRVVTIAPQCGASNLEIWKTLEKPANGARSLVPANGATQVRHA